MKLRLGYQTVPCLSVKNSHHMYMSSKHVPPENVLCTLSVSYHVCQSKIVTTCTYPVNMCRQRMYSVHCFVIIIFAICIFQIIW